MDIRPTDLVILQNRRIYLACKYPDGDIYLCHPERKSIKLALYDDKGKPTHVDTLPVYPRKDEIITKTIVNIIKKGDKNYEDLFIRYAYLERENI